MSAGVVAFVLAALCFFLALVGVSVGRVDLTLLGFLFLALGHVLGGVTFGRRPPG